MTRLCKSQVTDLVHKRTGSTRAQVGEVLTQFFEVIKEELAKGNGVTIPGFGSWRMKVLAPRVGRDLRDGQPIAIPPRTKVTFKAGSGLRKAAESSIEPEVYFGDGVAPSTELDAVFSHLFGEQGPNLQLEDVRSKIREAIGPNAEREAFEFFDALWQWKSKGLLDGENASGEIASDEHTSDENTGDEHTSDDDSRDDQRPRDADAGNSEPSDPEAVRK